MLVTRQDSKEKAVVKVIEWDDSITYVHAKAPATASNLAVGFDSLGLALDGPFDEIIIQKKSQPGLELIDITPSGDWPMQLEKNTATIAMQALLDDHPCDFGFKVSLIKGIPIGSGMGGSAASAVAAVCALNGFCEMQFTRSDLLKYILYSEQQVSGGIHPDNAVPGLWGGLTLSYTDDKVEPLPISNIKAVLLHPQLRIDTKYARTLLPNQVSFENYIKMTRRLAAWMAYLYQGDYEKFSEVMQDDVVEPARMELWPYFQIVKRQALDVGALAVCMSGSGPSMIALVDDNNNAKSIAEAMQQACRQQGYESSYWISQLPAAPAQIVERT